MFANCVVVNVNCEKKRITKERETNRLNSQKREDGTFRREDVSLATLRLAWLALCQNSSRKFA